MQHTVLLRSKSHNTVFRALALDAITQGKEGRKHSFRAQIEARDHAALVTHDGKELFWVCGLEDAPPPGLAALRVPQFMFPLEFAEVWLSCRTGGETHREYKPPAIENICGILPPQRVEAAGLRCSVSTPRRTFGYALTIPSCYGNVSFNRGFTQPLFRGVWDMAKFRKLMDRVGVNTDEMYVSLVVFSAQLGRKISISPDTPLFRAFPSLSGLKHVCTMDDQNNTLRFAQYRGKEVYMNFIVNRNGVVTARYFTDSTQEFDDAALAEMGSQLNALINTVMSFC